MHDFRQGRRSRKITVLFSRATGIRETRRRSRDIFRPRTRLYTRTTSQDILPGDPPQERGSALGVLMRSSTDRWQRSRSLVVLLRCGMKRLGVVFDTSAPQDLLPGDCQAARHRVKSLAVVPRDDCTSVPRVLGRPPSGSPVLMPVTHFRRAGIQGGIRIWVWAAAARIMQRASAAAAG